MVKRLSTIGRLIYGSAIGSYASNFSLLNLKKVYKENLVPDNLQGVEWSNEESLLLATTRGLSSGFNQQTIFRQYSNWWRYGDFSIKKSIDDQKYNREIQAILNFELLRGKETDEQNPVDENDSIVLLRTLPITLFEVANTKTANLYNSQNAMEEMHRIVGLTNNYPSAMIAVGTISFLIQQILIGNTIRISAENAIALSYEYYGNRAVFQTEINNLAIINLPDMSSINPKNFANKKDVFTILNKLFWLIFSSKNDQWIAFTLINKHFKTDKKILFELVGGIFALYNRKNISENLIEKIDNSTEIINDVLKNANRSNKFNV